VASVNKVFLIGRLGKDPELRNTNSGNSVCNMVVATSFSTGSGQDRQETTEWHNVVVWGKQASACERFLDKGREVFIEGRIQTRKWEDRDGNNRYTTEVIANRVEFLGKHNEDQGGVPVIDLRDEPDEAGADVPF